MACPSPLPLPVSLRFAGRGSERSSRARFKSVLLRFWKLCAHKAGTTRGVSAYIARAMRKAFRPRAFTAGLLANCATFASPGVAADTFASSENDIEPPYRR